MPQISLYIDEATLRKIEGAAAREKVSISRWVSDQLKSHIDPQYPKDFEKLFGSITDETFTDPGDQGLSTDHLRMDL